ncbi:MAG: GtrA family protein [Clostridia bacterium]|nr:GtrA family protein [Clostridia bacterium]
MKKKNLLQIVKFGFVGLLNTLIDYGMFFLFFSLFRLDKNIAQVLATLLAMTNSYLVNRYWTFEKSGNIQGGEIGRFIIVNILSLITTLLCLNLFYDVLGLHNLANYLLILCQIPFSLGDDLGVFFCKILAMPFSLAVNFMGNRLWVFREKNKKKTA